MHPIALGNRNGSFPSPFLASCTVCCACFMVVDECLTGKLSPNISPVNVSCLSSFFDCNMHINILYVDHFNSNITYNERK